jgi:signal transduction histidine kinase
VLLVLLNLSLYLPGGDTADAAAAIRPLFAGQDRSSWLLLVVGSSVFLMGVFLIGVLESHRTAGASFAIRRAVEAIRDGKTQIRIRLRRGDQLQELARSVNQLAETIDAERLHRG